MASDDELRARTIVCDNGTGFVKCGFAGDNFPTAVFPCMVGRPLLRYEEQIGDEQIGDLVVGDDCAKLRHVLEVTYPVRNGVVQNWDDMKLVRARVAPRRAPASIRVPTRRGGLMRR